MHAPLLCFGYEYYRSDWIQVVHLSIFFEFTLMTLAHWGRVTYICVSKLTIIGSDNGLSPDRRKAIIWTNVGILLNEPLRTNFSEILFEIYTFSCNEMYLKMSSGKWRPFCLDLNVLRQTKNYIILQGMDTMHRYVTTTKQSAIRVHSSWVPYKQGQGKFMNHSQGVVCGNAGETTLFILNPLISRSNS